MLSSLVFCCQIFLWFRISLKFPIDCPIHPWSILNHPGLLLSKFFLWFLFLFPLPIDNSHPPLTWSLVFWCRHWSSAVKYFSGFEFSLHFPIDCPIHPWSILNHPGLLLSKFFLWFRLFFPLPINNSHPPLTESLVFWCRPWSSAFKYSSVFEFSLHSPIDGYHPPLINSQSTWYSSIKILPLVLIFLYTPHR